MSAKYFCDGCGEELTPARRTHRDECGRLSGRVPIPGGHVMQVSVMTGIDTTANAGDFCDICIATAVRSALTQESTQP